MHTKTVAALTVAASLSLVACEEKPQAPAAPAPPPGGSAGVLDRVNDAGSRLAERAEGAVERARAEAVSAVERGVEEVGEGLTALRAKAEQVKPEMRQEFDQTLADIESHLGTAREKLASLRTAAADAWRDLSADALAALDRAGTQLRAAAEKYGLR